LDNKLDMQSPIFHPLVVAVHTLYARPFTHAFGVEKFDDSFVPAEFRKAHKILMEHRHQIYAHRDAKGFQVADYGVVNQVRAVRTKNHYFGLTATEFHTRYTAMPSIIKLCRALEEKTDYHVNKLWKKHKGKVPKQVVGEWLLNVLDQNAEGALIPLPIRPTS